MAAAEKIIENFQDVLVCNGSQTVFNVTDPALAMENIFSTTDTALYLLVMPFVCICGIFGNVLFLVSVATVPAMRSSVTFFMSNLAIADNLFLATVAFWANLDYWTSEVIYDYPIYSNAGCYAFLVTANTPYYASLLYITLISVERYLAVCKPLRHRLMKGKRRTVWLIGALLSGVRTSGYELHTTCFIWPPQEQFAHLPIHIGFCEPYALHADIMPFIVYCICLLINCAVSGKIVRCLMKQKLGPQDQMQSTRNQVTRTLILNNLVFFLCQLPIRILDLHDSHDHVSQIEFLDGNEYKHFDSIAYIFLLMNSCINPLVYVCCSQKYRRAMLVSIQKPCCRNTKTDNLNEAEEPKAPRESSSDDHGSSQDNTTRI